MAANKRRGERSLVFDHPPRVISASSIVGDIEGAGPLKDAFDLVLDDDLWGQDSWEKAECRMFETVVRMTVEKAGMETGDVHCLLGGDLLNQIITANFAARQLGIPFIGLYGACSTMAESLLLGCMQIDGGYAENTVCTASSHFSTAERQYRAPLEMGNTTPPTAQRTVTGAGAVLLASGPMHNGGEKTYKNVCITGATLGKVIDLGITDSANMGAAMAPAASDTIVGHMRDTGKDITDFDAVITGDLGSFGSDMLKELCGEEGLDLTDRHLDCGNLIYAPSQDVACGGSGCGCSACVLSAHILPLIESGAWKRVLFIATGALMSPASSMQGETIPCIAHAVVLEGGI